MAQNDKNDIDSLFDGKSEGASSDKGEETFTPPVIETNQRKYDLSKPEDQQAIAKDYPNFYSQYEKQTSELGELRKKVGAEDKSDDNKKQEGDPAQQLTPEQIKAQEEYDKQLLRKYGVTFKEDIENEKYEDSKKAEVNKFAQKYGLPVADVMKEIDESIKNTGVKIEPSQVEDWYAAKHPKEFRQAREKMIRADHPGNHYTETSRKEGIELPDEEVPQFGRTVQDQALELLGVGAE